MMSSIYTCISLRPLLTQRAASASQVAI